MGDVDRKSLRLIIAGAVVSAAGAPVCDAAPEMIVVLRGVVPLYGALKRTKEAVRADDVAAELADHARERLREALADRPGNAGC